MWLRMGTVGALPVVSDLELKMFKLESTESSLFFRLPKLAPNLWHFVWLCVRDAQEPRRPNSIGRNNLLGRKNFCRRWFGHIFWIIGATASFFSQHRCNFRFCLARSENLEHLVQLSGALSSDFGDIFWPSGTISAQFYQIFGTSEVFRRYFIALWERLKHFYPASFAFSARFSMLPWLLAPFAPPWARSEHFPTQLSTPCLKNWKAAQNAFKKKYSGNRKAKFWHFGNFWPHF